MCGSDIRYRIGPPVVRNMRAVRKTGFCGMRRIFRGIRCKKTGFSSTGVIFGTGNPLLWYGADIRVRRTAFCGTRHVFRGSRCADNYLLLIQEPEHPERDLIVEDVFSIVLDHIAIFDVFNLFLSFLSPANLKGLSVNLKI